MLIVEKKDKTKVIFSGGALYKTFSGDNLFYTTIDDILSQEKNVYFWYAGNGDDSKIKVLKEKFPKRVFFTKERKDLYQLLCNCDVYYSTYPICGGLMFQYAAIAGKVPLTLKNSEITDGFLLKQKDLHIEFLSPDDLKEECIHLLTDEVYCKNRSEEMKCAVISKEKFDSLVKQLVLRNIEKNDIEMGSYKKNMYLCSPFTIIECLVNLVKNKNYESREKTGECTVYAFQYTFLCLLDSSQSIRNKANLSIGY